MFSRSSQGGISQIIQTSFCSSTMPRSWSTPIVAHLLLSLLFLCTPGYMLLSTTPNIISIQSMGHGHALLTVPGWPATHVLPPQSCFSWLLILTGFPQQSWSSNGRLLLSYSAWSSIENMCSPGMGFTSAGSDTVSSCMGFHLSPASSSARLLLHMWCFSETSFPNYRVGLEQEFSMYEEKLGVEIGHSWTLENYKNFCKL